MTGCRSRWGLLALVAVLAPLTACSSPTTGASDSPAALSLAKATPQPDLPIFASPGAGRVDIPAYLLQQEAQQRAAAIRAAAATATAARASSAPRRASSSPSPRASTTPSPSSPSTAAPSTDDFRPAYQSVKQSVGYFLSRSCDGTQDYLGTGFLVGPDLVLTAGHVVKGMSAWQFTMHGRTLAGSVIGLDPAQDVALVRLAVRTTLPVLHLLPAAPLVGTPVGGLGFVLGLGTNTDTPALTTGIVSGVDRAVDDPADGLHQTGLLETDMASNHGQSGGPVVTIDGQVAGIVDGVAGSGSIYNVQLSVGSAVAAERVAAWTAHPQVVALC